jgi:hypothetical protein
VARALFRARGLGVAQLPTGLPVRVSMKWRTRLAVLLGLLLPVPLVWLLYTARDGGVPRGASETRTAPMLSLEERRSLMTYERSCRKSEECEPPLGCFINPRAMARYCTDSRCMTDRHCPEGFVCRSMKTEDEGVLVRACALVGVRVEGETCKQMPVTRESGCASGLLCQGWCGRPCQVAEPASCPEGFLCREGPDGPSCLPTCEGRSCPEGQQCVRFAGGISRCAEIHGRNCQQTSCPGGQQCFVHSPSIRPGEVWMWCVEPCGEGGPSCAEGFICHMRYCRQSCEPGVPGSCAPHYKCDRYSDSEPWTCGPDY